ncbi:MULTISPECIES: hypothetical protein [Thiorhodovibrio]|uniref:hypothetical protein n=1 Tax=Thiorhodovibrio TaxID=61593 RepID=UPI00191412A4|nr:MULTISPECIES: hypothetical protein [Thiorhodovibrio]MBK5969067.1 hypothetical protein [Thiorhodovibrio winogradskyi]WPL14720.1 hypothetical protein Thiosp_04575 [Thiorhodovibrio litoralis]
MSGRWLINGALLLACALLLLLARWQPEPAQGLADVVGLTPETVTRIRIRHGQETPLELVAAPEGWTMHGPLQGRINDTMAERLAALLRAPATRAFGVGNSDAGDARDAPAALADLGLADPWLELDLNDIHLRAGAAEPIDRRRYLQAGNDILLIDDRWLLPLLTPPEDYLLRTESPGSEHTDAAGTAQDAARAPTEDAASVATGAPDASSTAGPDAALGDSAIETSSEAPTGIPAAAASRATSD